MGTSAATCRARLRRPDLKRAIELVLATVAAVTSVGVTIPLWQSESISGGSLWPLPGLVLLEIAVFGLVGLAAVVLDSAEGSHRWGQLTWGIIGGLLVLMVLGAFTIGPLIFPVVLGLSITGLLADQRRGRRRMVNMALAATGGISNFLLILALIVVTLP